MTKFRILLYVLLAAIPTSANGSLILSAIYDGSGSTPKGLEIFVESGGTFDNWTVDIQSNGGTFASQFTFPAGSTYAAGDFLYVTSTATDPVIVAKEMASNAFVLPDGSFNMNGDDAVRISDDMSAVIDQFGETGVDGSGTMWEYADSYATRTSGTTANGSFVLGDWNVRAVNTLDPGNAPLLSDLCSYAPVPEPSPFFLIGIAMLGIIALSDRK